VRLSPPGLSHRMLHFLRNPFYRNGQRWFRQRCNGSDDPKTGMVYIPPEGLGWGSGAFTFAVFPGPIGMGT
jgi:hypothetical protein